MSEMEILDITVKHYGKFENYRMAFRPGMNIICGGNEAGKSTLHSFLRAMLFGLPRGRGRAARTDEYQLRQPWENPGYFAGEMRIREAGDIYRIQRDFSGHGQPLTVVCETKERELEAPQEFLAQMLAGMREAAFCNTIFVSQAGARTDEGLAEELRSFMVNYENSLDERLDVTGALDRLRKRKKGFEQKKRQEEELLDARIQKCQTEGEYIRREISRLKQQVHPTGEQETEAEESTGLSGGGKAGNAAKALLAAGGMLSFAGAVFLDSMVVHIFLGISGLVFFGFFYLAWRLLREPKEEAREERTQRGREVWKQERLCEEIRSREEAYQKLQNELEALYQRYTALDGLQTEIDALDLAIQRICELSMGIYERSGGTLNDRASSILSALTRKKYQRITIDDTLEVRVHTRERILRLWQLSYGTMQQIYFSLRMAAGELFAGEKNLPLILDEPFAMYDDARTRAALKWLNGCGRQVILFTCQNREEAFLKEIRSAR